MSNEIAKVETHGFSTSQLEVLSRTIAKGLSADEMQMFLYTCARTKLDPFAKQIYAIKRGANLCIQTAVDGFRLIAERSGKYAPGRDTEFLYDKNGQLSGAKVYVKKMTPDGTWHEVSATALISEYRGQGLWTKMPHVMIEKCAECRALRRCFPAELSGIYGDEEMDQADKQPEPIECEVVQEKKQLLSQKMVDELISKMTEEHREKATKYCKKNFGTEDLRHLSQESYDSIMKKAIETLNAEVGDEG